MKGPKLMILHWCMNSYIQLYIYSFLQIHLIILIADILLWNIVMSIKRWPKKVTKLHTLRTWGWLSFNSILVKHLWPFKLMLWPWHWKVSRGQLSVHMNASLFSFDMITLLHVVEQHWIFRHPWPLTLMLRSWPWKDYVGYFQHVFLADCLKWIW